ncbi:MAG: condensation domain-containing protein, partial [Thermodesulfobacteriota bacterium]
MSKRSKDLLTQKEKQEFVAGQYREKETITETFPLSLAQQRIWYFEQLFQDTPVYNIPFAWRVVGSLKVGALVESLIEIQKRHDVLRTIFSTSEGQPIQFIARSRELQIKAVDLSKLTSEEQEKSLMRIKMDESRIPFDLSSGPLIRSKVIKLAEEDHVLLITIHHIVFDGWSTQVFNQEISTIYQALSDGSHHSLPELPIQYPDFAVWQCECSGELLLDAQLSYWKRKLNDCQYLKLATDHPRPSVNTFRGTYKSFELSKTLYESLKELSLREGVTLFMTIQAAFKTLLHLYTSQEDIVIGTDIAYRNQTQTEPLIGLFANTLVLRTDVSGNPNFKELLSRVRETALEAYRHQDLPFEQLVGAVHPTRDLSHHPFFNVMLIMQDEPAKNLKLPGLSIYPLEVHTGTSKVDLILFIWEGENSLRGEIEYYTEIFDECTIIRMIEHFETLLFEIVRNPDRQISEISLLSPEEKHQLLIGWNQTKTEHSDNKCVQDLFESQVMKTPNSVALVFGEEHLTYKELNERANQLAHYLSDHGVGPDYCVGVCLERSIDMIVGLLGILKAGGAYIPLDPAYPRERLDFMLEDSDTKVVLTKERFLGRLSNNGAHIVCVDTQW